MCNPIALTAFTDSVTSFELHPKFPASTVGPILIYYEIRPYFQNHDFHVRSIKNCPPIGTVATDDLMNMPIVKDAFYCKSDHLERFLFYFSRCIVSTKTRKNHARYSKVFWISLKTDQHT